MNDDEVHRRFEHMSRSIDGILRHLNEGTYKFGALEKLTDRLETSVGKLEVIVYQGNHQPSLVAQVAALKTAVPAAEEKVDKSSAAGFFKTSQERVALIAAVSGFAMALLALIK